MSNEAATFMMSLAGRDIEFRHASLGQILMLQRLYARAIKSAQGDEETQDRVDLMGSAMVKVIDFIDSLMVHPQDREFVEEQMLIGNIDHNDLLAALRGGKDAENTPDDEAPAPRKKAAPRKSPKAAPAATTVATRGRAKR